MDSIVFGTNGYLGKNLTVFLRDKGHKIKCFDLQPDAFDNSLDYKRIDISIKSEFESIDLNIDYIYFFSGITGAWDGFENYEKYIDVNEKGLLNLLTAMIAQNSKAKIIFPSTRLVYKGQKDKKLKEEDDKEPKTIYALNKLVCEQLLELYRNTFGINYTVYRICVPYGQIIPGELSYGTIGFFMNKAKNKENITLYGDGNQKRTFTHVEDICSKIFESVSKPESNGNIYNIGGDTASLVDIAISIAKKHDVKVEFIEWPENALKIESGDTVFDGSKLEDISSIKYIKSILAI